MTPRVPPDGYSVAIQTLYLEARTLQAVITSLALKVEGPGPGRRVFGTFALNKDALGIVGQEKRVHMLTSFVGPCSSERKPIAPPGQLGEVLAAAFEDKGFGVATFGYNEPDTEIGNDEEWWCELHLEEPYFSKLYDAVVSRVVAALTLGLRPSTFYVRDTDFHAPPSASVSWFLPTDEAGRPRLGHAEITSFLMKLEELTLPPRRGA
jgi:hypothetical protein